MTTKIRQKWGIFDVFGHPVPDPQKHDFFVFLGVFEVFRGKPVKNKVFDGFRVCFVSGYLAPRG